MASFARIQRTIEASERREGRAAKITDLKAQIKALEKENSLLKKQLNELKNPVDGSTNPTQ